MPHLFLRPISSSLGLILALASVPACLLISCTPSVGMLAE